MDLPKQLAAASARCVTSLRAAVARCVLPPRTCLTVELTCANLLKALEQQQLRASNSTSAARVAQDVLGAQAVCTKMAECALVLPTARWTAQVEILKSQLDRQFAIVNDH